MIRWLYEHVFRGIGIVMLVAMITILYLAVTSQMHQSTPHETRPAAANAAR